MEFSFSALPQPARACNGPADAVDSPAQSIITTVVFITPFGEKRTLLKMLRKLNKKSGFTLIELLVVVLILAILMAVALPLYLNAVADSSRKTCRANMQTIANAVQAA